MDARELKSPPKPDEIKEEADSPIDCTICTTPAKDAVEGPCKHFFCKTCIDSWYKQKGWDGKREYFSAPCPCCKKSTFRKDFIASITIQKAVLVHEDNLKLLKQMTELKEENEKLKSPRLNTNSLGKSKTNFIKLFKIELETGNISSQLINVLFKLTIIKATLAYKRNKLRLLQKERAQLELEFKDSMQKSLQVSFEPLAKLSLADAQSISEGKELKNGKVSLQQMHAAVDQHLYKSALAITQKEQERRKKLKSIAAKFFPKTVKSLILEKRHQELVKTLSGLHEQKMELHYTLAHKEYARLISGSSLFKLSPEKKASGFIASFSNNANLAEEKSTPEFPLITAIQTNNVKLVERLLAENTDPNIRNKLPVEIQSADEKYKVTGPAHCYTALALSIALHGVFRANAQFDILKRLLDAKADITFRFSDGKTLLHLAADLQDIEVIRELIKRGADPNLIDSEGQTPLAYAKTKFQGTDVNEIEEALKPLASEKKLACR